MSGDGEFIHSRKQPDYTHIVFPPARSLFPKRGAATQAILDRLEEALQAKRIEVNLEAGNSTYRK